MLELFLVFRLELGYQDYTCGGESYFHAGIINCQVMEVEEWIPNPHYVEWETLWESEGYQVRINRENDWEIWNVAGCEGIKKHDFWLMEGVGIDNYNLQCEEGFLLSTGFERRGE